MNTPKLFIPGAFVIRAGVYRFRCPVCGHTFRSDDRYEPICTGPHWTDDHPPTVMREVQRTERQVSV